MHVVFWYMISGVGKLGEFPDLGRKDTVWFYSEKPYEFKPNAGPTKEFDSGYFMIAKNPTDFLLFDGETIEYNLKGDASYSCFFCMEHEEDLVNVASVEMPYGYVDYETVFRRWENSGESYDPIDKCTSICPSCLEKIETVIEWNFDSKEEIFASML